MQNFNEKVKLEFNEQLGRHYVTTLDVEAGETLLLEQPLFVAPDWECAQLKCANCFEDSYIMCNKCDFFPLCMDCQEHDAYECAFAARLPKQLLVRNFGIYAALKLLLLLENPATSASCAPLLQQSPPNAALRDTELWREHETLVVAPLLAANVAPHFAQLDADFLHRLCLLIDTHAFELNNKAGDTLKGVYVCGTQLPHDCVPNVVVALDDNRQLKLYASVPIGPGAVLFNSYANPLMGTSQRQHHLRMTRLHDCACARCLDPTELGTHLSSLKCAKCEAGYANCALAGSGDWVCQSCGAVLPAHDVHMLLAELGEAMVGAAGELEQYEQLLAQYAPRLHPNHFLLLDIKQNIACLLRAMLTSPLLPPSKAVLQRRVQLSEEILPVVCAVTPGLSKLYAITLFEYLLALIELIELQFKQDELTSETFKLKLKLAREIAKKSMNMLQFEPDNSLEGHVLRRLAHEQKRIEQHLKKLQEN